MWQILEYTLIKLRVEHTNTSSLALERLISGNSLFYIMKLGFLCEAEKSWKELMENPARKSALWPYFSQNLQLHSFLFEEKDIGFLFFVFNLSLRKGPDF